jgi:hypothetical protein
MFVYLYVTIKNVFAGIRKKAFLSNDKFIY